jgi:alginate O-acetyltransferase complex protein AlgI
VVFSSIQFLFYFLPITVALYYLVNRKLRNTVLLIASLVFYTWGGGAFLFILLTVISVNYLAGLMIHAAQQNGRDQWARAALGLAVVANIGLLGFFKYANFAIAQVNAVSEVFGKPAVEWTAVVLPIGISFFTFQSLSYTIDVSRGTAQRLKNPLDFGMFVALFPQLIAGPIVRYHELADQIKNRTVGIDRFAQGVMRFAHGLFKKVVIADSVGAIADAAFGTDPGSLTTAAAWLGVAAYTVQIYFDFSGYSDMAIGLGALFGFQFPENFRRPYSAISVTDFWRRWHMTLSNWFRDYLYIPLGGSRNVSQRRLYFNLWFVFAVTGLWHGANWTFLIWGLYHGALLILERVFHQRPVDEASHAWVRRGVVLFLVVMGWVIFRADSLTHAYQIYRTMFGSVGGMSDTVAASLTARNTLVLAVSSLVVLLPRTFVGGVLVADGRGRWAALARAALFLVALPYAAFLVASGSFSPFLYFQF